MSRVLEIKSATKKSLGAKPPRTFIKKKQNRLMMAVFISVSAALIMQAFSLSLIWSRSQLEYAGLDISGQPVFTLPRGTVGAVVIPATVNTKIRTTPAWNDYKEQQRLLGNQLYMTF